MTAERRLPGEQAAHPPAGWENGGREKRERQIIPLCLQGIGHPDNVCPL